MGNIGGGEILVILLVALIFLGPDKLPEVARQIGKVMGEVRKVSAGFQREMQDAMRVPDEPVRTPPVIDAAAEQPPLPASAAVVTVVEGIDADGPFVETTVSDAPAETSPPTAPAPTEPAPTDPASTDPVADLAPLDPAPTDTAPAPAEVATVTPSEAPPMPDAAYGGDR